jgi:hypothetical protein
MCRTLGLAAVLVVLAVGCSDSKPSKDQVVDAVIESGIDERAAQCAVDGFYDDLSAASLERIVNGSESLDDPEQETIYTDAFETCLAVGFDMPDLAE